MVSEGERMSEGKEGFKIEKLSALEKVALVSAICRFPPSWH